jgi:hypothetical protein
MNKLICSEFVATLSLSAFSATAATSSASKISKMMDTDGNGTISKAEYMAYHEQAFDNMKQTYGEVSKRNMHSAMQTGYYRNYMNNKPIGTTIGVSHNGSTDDTKIGGPVNGTHSGTN